jgi:thioredoxin 1
MKIYKFYADWCTPCKMMTPLVDKACNELDLTYEAINVDDDKELSSKFGIRNIPVLIVEKENGDVEKLIGAHPYNKIQSFLEEHGR